MLCHVMLCQPHSVHSPPGSPHPAHITSSQSPPSLWPITPSTFQSRLKTHLFHKPSPSQSFWTGSIWTTFTDLGLGPDLMGTGVCFVLVSYLMCFGYLY